MNRLSYIKATIPAVALLMLGGCIDDNYDLSDIDKTTEIKAEDLVVPINLAPIKLEKIIDIDENNPDAAIQIDPETGNYCVNKKGSFTGSATVAKVRANSPGHINDTRVTISAETPMSSQRRIGDFNLTFNIPSEETSFNYDINNVDPAIRSIKHIGLDPDNELHLTITLSAAELQSVTDQVTFKNLVIALPEGLEASCTINDKTFHATDGRLEIDEVTGYATGIQIQLVARGIDLMHLDNGQLVPLEIKNGAFNYGGKLGISSGKLVAHIKSDLTLADVPHTATFMAQYAMTGFVVDSFSGEIDYTVDMGRISPVDLSDIPDFLNDDRTHLNLSNPQIFLSISNPVAYAGLDCEFGITIYGERDGVGENTAAPSDPITIDHVYGDVASLLLAPDPAESNFNADEDVPFGALSTVLYGNGLPKRLQIELSIPTVPKPRVIGMAEDFKLGQTLYVGGDYVFYTDLAVDASSTIVYAKQEDGWNDDDVNAIRITKFDITADADNQMPMAASLVAWPVVKENGISKIDKKVKATANLGKGNQGLTLNFVNATDPAQPFVIEHLDGIYFEATLDNFDGQPLKPEQTITITNLRPVVSGSYTKDLDF